LGVFFPKIIRSPFTQCEDGNDGAPPHEVAFNLQKNGRRTNFHFTRPDRCPSLHQSGSETSDKRTYETALKQAKEKGKLKADVHKHQKTGPGFFVYIFGRCLFFSFSARKQFILTHNSSAMFSLQTIYPSGIRRKAEKNLFIYKTHLATQCVVIFYSAGITTHDRRIGSSQKVKKYQKTNMFSILISLLLFLSLFCLM
jgi:hypothetical protein